MPNPLIKTGPWGLPYILLQDRKANGTGGGISTTATYATRTLNTKVFDTNNLCVLVNNQFSLAAGTYRIVASAPSRLTERHRCKLRNVTDGIDVLLGPSEYSASGGDKPQDRCWVSGQFRIAAGKWLAFQHYTAVAATTFGYGVDASSGEVEVFAVVELWKLS